MRWVVALVVCLFLVRTVPTIAQDSSRPVIDPATIFAPGIEIVETLPVLSYDNDARLVSYFDASLNEWQSYEYPSDLGQIQDYQRRTNGTYLLSNKYYEGIAGAIWEQVWLFNPVVGTIEHPPKVCNLVQALSGEGQWRLTKLNDELYRLCNTETGKYSEPLPHELQANIKLVCTPGDYYSSGVPSTSPDGEWVVFTTCSQNENPFIRTVYVYEIENETFSVLGISDTFEYIDVLDWVDDTHPLIKAGDLRTGGYHSVYFADVTQSGSGRWIAGQYAYKPAYFKDSSRIYWVVIEWGSEEFGAAVQQIVNKYDLQSDETSTVLEHPCNNHTCEAGYVEWGDDQHIVILNGYPLNTDFSASIWSVETGEALYVTPTRQIHAISHEEFLFDTVNLETNNLIFKSVNVGFLNEFIYPEGIFDIRNSISVSPDQRYILNGGYDVYSANVYDLQGLKQYAVLQQLEDGYTVDIKWNEDDLLQVSLLNKAEACGYSRCILSSWLVRVPDESAAP